MGWRFRRSVGFGPLRLNLSKKGAGMSVGGLGQRVTLRADGRVTHTSSLPGTGLSHQSTLGRVGESTPLNHAGAIKAPSSTPGGCLVPLALVVGVVGASTVVVGFRDSSPALFACGVAFEMACAAIVAMQTRMRGSALRKLDEENAAAEREREARQAAEAHAQQLFEAEHAAQQAAEAHARQAWEAERAGRRAGRVADLTARFGADIAEKIVAERVWEGATFEMIELSLGKPVDTAQKVLKTKTKDTWKYKQISGNQFRLRIMFENGVCVGWEER
jgi:hypothetical protein